MFGKKKGRLEAYREALRREADAMEDRVYGTLANKQAVQQAVDSLFIPRDHGDGTVTFYSPDLQECPCCGALVLGHTRLSCGSSRS